MLILSGYAYSYRWYTVHIQGKDGHTGTTPLNARSDALLCAARMIVASNSIASKFGGLASTGILKALPGSVNTIPGNVSFSLDIRAGADGVLEDMDRAMKESFQEIANGTLQIEWILDAESRATYFDDHAIDCIEQSCKAIFGTRTQELVTRMVSGAGHDSVFTSRRVPTAMVFVPCKDGLSHNPEEYCEASDCAIGTQVLIDAVLRFDASRS